MITRDDVLTQAVDDCLKELYQLAVPHIEWEDFMEENKIYSKKYKIWESYCHSKHTKNEHWEEWKQTYPNWENKTITECIGPRPYEFYFLPREILKDICDSYVYAYRIDAQEELLNTIAILKNYCREPIIDKWIEGKDGERGYRGYEHPDNLEKGIQKLIQEYDSSDISKEISEKCCNKFFEFLDMAGKFYNWNRDLNAFNVSVYLGPSPNSDKQTVIDNWKKYRNKDIEIDEEQIKKEFYEEDYNDE